MPRLGNVQLSVKLGLAFGIVLALTAGIVAINLRDTKRLESAHRAVTEGVVPRLVAAQQAAAAFADVHFAQTRMVLAKGAGRTDELKDLASFERSVTQLRRLAGGGAGLGNIETAIQSFKATDDKIFAA